MTVAALKHQLEGHRPLRTGKIAALRAAACAARRIQLPAAVSLQRAARQRLGGAAAVRAAAGWELK